MRKDMKKKLVDTHREGSGRFRRRGKRGKVLNPEVIRMRRERIDLDEDGELSENIRSPRKAGYRYKDWDRKHFGENLNPLWRYLNSQIGRNWDTVYSEICENMDRRSAVGGHIFEHLDSYVTLAKEVRIVDGVPHRTHPYLGGLEPITYTGRIREWGCFYVDPRDNKLKRGVARGETERRKQIRERKEDREDRLRKIGKDLWMSRHPETDLWYRLVAVKQEYQYVTVSKRDVVWSDGSIVRDENGVPTYKTRDQVVKEPVYESVPFPEGLFVPEGKIVVSCKSANKKDLRNL